MAITEPLPLHEMTMRLSLVKYRDEPLGAKLEMHTRHALDAARDWISDPSSPTVLETVVTLIVIAVTIYLTR